MTNTDEETIAKGHFLIQGSVPGEMGECYSRDSDAKKADGKLDEAEGVVEAGNRAIREIGGEVAVDHDIDLDGGGSDGCGAKKAKDLLEAWIVPNKEPTRLVAERDGSRNHHEPLGKASY